MAYTYSKLAETTVGVSGTTAITFSNIPQNYTDLLVKLSLRTNYNLAGTYYHNFDITINGGALAITAKQVFGYNGSTTGSNSNINVAVAAAQNTANVFNSIEFYLPNYTSSNYKSIINEQVTEGNFTDEAVGLLTGLWSSPAAINQLTFTPRNSASFVQYSTATLYGIRVEI